MRHKRNCERCKGTTPHTMRVNKSAGEVFIYCQRCGRSQSIYLDPPSPVAPPVREHATR